MVLVPIRADNAYFSFGKQAAQGTAVAPTNFVRWLDGSSIEIDLKTVPIPEGDGSRRMSLIVKGYQSTKIKLACTPRPVEAGLLEAMCQGVNADAIIGVAPTTTTTAAITGGTSTSASITASTNIPTVNTFWGVVDAGLSTQEVVLFSLPVTGAGPFTITVAASYNGGKFVLSHLSGATFASVAAVNNTVNSAATQGGTTLVLATNFNLTTSGTSTVIVDPGLTTEEIVTLTTPGSGSAPSITYTLANGATLKSAHAVGAVVLSAVSHSLTDQIDGVYWTWEVGIGSLNGQGGLTLRVRDVKASSLKRNSKAGDYLHFELELEGLVSVAQATPSTVTLENHSPYIFYNSKSGWTIDGSTAGDAPYVEEFSVTQKNNCDVVQTEGLNGDAIIYGRLDLEYEAKVAYQATSVEVAKTYFGGSGGTTDSSTVILGALIALFTNSDGFSSLSYTLPTLVYTKAPIPTPKADGKHYVQAFNATAISNMGQNAQLLTVVAANGRTSPY